MSSFSQRVINIVARIPRGKNLTYKEVAKKAGNAKAARAVGNILNKHYKKCLEDGSITIQCHRVIRGDGKIGGYVLGERKKRELLKAEEYAGLSKKRS